jgi:hypothetical protein
MALIFGAPDLTVYAEDQMVQIVCLPPDGTIVERCDKASRIILTIKEAKGLIFTLRDAVRIIREGG